MTEETPSSSNRARARAATQARRARAAALRQGYFKALASGFTPEQIAEASHASVRTIRREIDRALDERRLDAPERYVHLQVARLTKALRLADYHIEQGDLAAVGPWRRSSPRSTAITGFAFPPRRRPARRLLVRPFPHRLGAHPRPAARRVRGDRGARGGRSVVRSPDYSTRYGGVESGPK